MVTIGVTATVSLHGKVHDVGKLGGVMDAIDATPSGELVIGDNMLKLITPSGAVKVLSGTATVDGFAVSRDGRYVAWSVSPGSYRAKEIYQLYLYDLQRRRDRALTPADQAGHAGRFPGRRPGGDLGRQLRPVLPVDAVRPAGWPSSAPARCPASLTLRATCWSERRERRLLGRDQGLPYRQERAAAQCRGRRVSSFGALSPDGTRWLAGVLTGLDDRLVVCQALPQRPPASSDPRLSRLFLHERMSITDGVWLDSGHLLVIAQRYKPGPRSGASSRSSAASR